MKVLEFLDETSEGLEASPGNVPRVQWLMDELTWQLRGWRRTMPVADWKNVVSSARSHRLCKLVHQDPFTDWSFRKPRGYPGDASLLDFIYGEPEVEGSIRSSTELGRSIFARNRNVPSCRAVRYRKKILADRLNEIEEGKVLSIACGHLRELRSVASQSLEITAFDADETSLEEVRNSNRSKRVNTIKGSVRNIVAGKFLSTGFNYVYAAGLYDYLATPLAQRLTQRLFEKVAPGGSLLIANFTHDTEDVGYMETYKDWWLTFRDESEMLEIARAVPREEVSTIDLFRDPDRHIVFAELHRSES